MKSLEAVLEAGVLPVQPQTKALPIPDGDKPTPGAFYRVRFGEGLRAIAVQAYGHADREDIIMAANPIITDHNRIYDGQVILLPLKSPPAGPTLGSALPLK